MTSRVPLSPSEWLLFAAIARAPLPLEGATASWVRERARKHDGELHALTTITTLLNRLQQKGWIRIEYEDPSPASPAAAPPVARRALRSFYFPTLTYQEALRELLEHFLTSHQLHVQDVEQALPALAD